MAKIRKTGESTRGHMLILLSEYIKKTDEEDVSRLYSGFDEWLRLNYRARLSGNIAASVYNNIQEQKELGFPIRFLR